MRVNPFDEYVKDYDQDPPSEPEWYELVPIVDGEVIPSSTGSVVPMPYVPETLYELYS
jgi:hypothetical protein